MGDIAEWMMNQALEEEFYDEWLEHNDDNLPTCSSGLKMTYSNDLKKLSHDQYRGTVYWKTKDSRKILIKDLDDNHLNNIIKFLKKENEFEDLINLMIAEQNYRNLKSLKDLKNHIEPDYYNGFY